VLSIDSATHKEREGFFMQETASYPVRFSVRYPESLNPILNLPLFIGTMIKTILLIPHLIILWLLGAVAGVVVLIGTIVILFTGSFPPGLFIFVVGVQRWVARSYSYLLSLRDEYPPFSMESFDGEATSLEIDYPPTLNRWLNFPIIGIAVKSILTIPHLIILFFAGFVAFFAIFIAQFAILFTGRFPESMFKIVSGWTQLAFRWYSYVYALTDNYPPFSLSPTEAQADETGLSGESRPSEATGDAGAGSEAT
jgi:Domain of unknown function (DUF4389)